MGAFTHWWSVQFVHIHLYGGSFGLWVLGISLVHNAWGRGVMYCGLDGLESVRICILTGWSEFNGGGNPEMMMRNKWEGGIDLSIL